jgi:hypothetical protein
MARSVAIDGKKVVIDGTPLTVLTLEEYQQNRSVPTHLIVVSHDGFMRVKRSNGNAFMQTPMSKDVDGRLADADRVRQYVAAWFLTHEGTLDEKLEEVARAAAKGS